MKKEKTMSQLAISWFTCALLLAIFSPKESMPFEPQNDGIPDEMYNDETDDEDSFGENENGIELFQGDIVQDTIADDGIPNQGVLEKRLWYNGIVPYKIHPMISDLSKIQKIEDAMAVIENVSCIKFKKKEHEDHYFIKIFGYRGENCSAHVGAKYDTQFINVGQVLRLDDNCYDQGTILHELMHAIGFEHEQARTDRDEFVEIIYNNISPKYKYNFNKTVDLEVSHLNTTYDYYSIMHYKWNAFARDKNKPTIKLRNNAIDYKTLGNRGSLSPIDIIEINTLYDCSGTFAQAQFNLGVMYLNGEGVPQSNEKAVEWFSKAAEQGYAQAQNSLGFMYRRGYGVPQSNERAVEWYAKSAEQGYAKAQFNLGFMYRKGYGVPQSNETAVQWCAKSAEQGYAKAQFNLGFMYRKGYGVPQSNERAVEWYEKAAEQGFAQAQFNLGYMYEKGYGVPQSNEKAVEWYSKAAEQGYAQAQTNLGVMYEKGNGIPQSNEKAVEWYAKAAEPFMLGGTVAPAKIASCSLRADTGSVCHPGYRLVWHYDTSDGGDCIQFWYGGCDGNDNRFPTEEQCKTTCVDPPGVGRCYLPKVEGSERCNNLAARYWYDFTTRQCGAFWWRGCDGNSNNFDTWANCQAFCEGIGAPEERTEQPQPPPTPVLEHVVQRPPPQDDDEEDCAPDTCSLKGKVAK